MKQTSVSETFTDRDCQDFRKFNGVRANGSSDSPLIEISEWVDDVPEDVVKTYEKLKREEYV